MEKSRERKEYRVPSDLSEVQKASAKVLDDLKPLSLNEAVRFDIRLCLEEALINAMKYGNRLCRDLDVLLAVEYDAASVSLVVEDQGSGFDVSRLQDCTEEKNLLRNRGRGVYLIHQLMDRVEYNDKGNRLVMVKYLQRHESGRN